ncbi:fructose-bisphosphate aldolase [Candidatus Woesebacteria bacterium RIFCSPHIGHO2_01_FULL_44_21]|uniref:Probable fructose-bisphosphate aldolase class 1 n=1 Tax=Candidatus Woesebacteria bacterium RIFCSPHIGHO2_01_FULL_44_21 TaxID=1802503 RepID=A0A1F7Z0F5_9BACT|nr:MAG: fructose-bisphosphate aldolase [Candidatus Woesebacteria bacterium RIFCSPHIGHO2_01_FULL_44_21]OGM70577.1 MAG: fructose-bisphosphate aldolase [Candidatus Woesebacteria bacterium RIFCSPLOWO2_01_FULL_44_24b]
MSTLSEVAQKLVADNKGILAADESTGTIEKRFAKINLESTEENRRIYRELLFTTPKVEEFISGVIMFDETIKQHAGDGRSFVQVLTDKGIIPGIKVDKGKIPLAGFPDEEVTEGLDGLRDRLNEYRDLGAQFAKWRGVFKIGQGLPTKGAVHANAHALARYAALAQEAELVPIVEPEVLMDGDHSIEECGIVTGMVLDEVFAELFINKVDMNGMLLKPNMVLAGEEAENKSTADDIASATLEVFKKSVPAEVPGIVFLSGGQSSIEATKNLCELNRDKKSEHPWALSFSFGRALQNEALEAWHGSGDNWQKAQEVFYNMAKADAEARRGVC